MLAVEKGGVMGRLMQTVVGGLTIAKAQVQGELVLMPLVALRRLKVRYVLLDEALQRGRLVIREIDQGGQVPYLRATNRGPRPVLVHDGEELVGAKQNRIANVTMLLGVGERVLPVSCVEAGRWRYDTPTLRAAGRTAHPSMRRTKERDVRESLARAEHEPGPALPHSRAPADSVPFGRRTHGVPRHQISQEERVRSFQGNQGAVWDEIAAAGASLSVDSPTSAMSDMYEARGQEIEGRLLALTGEGEQQLPPGTVGVAAFLRDRFLCLDALWPAERFAHFYPKLARGYLFEELTHHSGRWAQRDLPAVDPEAHLLRLLARLPRMDCRERPSADLGRDLRLSGQGHLAAGLVWQDRLIQLSVFPG
jgi:hypothetical protein